MKYIFIPFFIAINFALQAQNTSRPINKRVAAFPNTFVGNWKGTMLWSPNNGKAPMQVAVQLNVQHIKDSTNQYTWQIIYGDKKEDVRPYTLRKVDTVKNHWVIDENNGILIDCYWLGNKLISAFAVQGNVVQDSYWLQNNELHFEFISYGQKPTSTTGTDTEDSPTVDLMKIRSYQKGVMKRVK
jgi:hypothetical protein